MDDNKPWQFKKGQRPWNKGSITKTCQACDKNFEICPSKVRRGWGHYCSAFCRIEGMRGHIPWNKGLKGFMAGERHWNWQGGIQTENTKIRRSARYKKWVLDIFKRDNFTCQRCFKKEEESGRLNADHILPFCVFKTRRFDLFNGRTLCVDCHKKTTKIGRDWIKAFQRISEYVNAR